jgi:hypothetical protein
VVERGGMRRMWVGERERGIMTHRMREGREKKEGTEKGKEKAEEGKEELSSDV